MVKITGFIKQRFPHLSFAKSISPEMSDGYAILVETERYGTFDAKHNTNETLWIAEQFI
jgi:hypothetical protein